MNIAFIIIIFIDAGQSKKFDLGSQDILKGSQGVFGTLSKRLNLTHIFI